MFIFIIDIYTHIHTYLHTHIYEYIGLFRSMSIYICLCLWILIQLVKYIYIHMHITLYRHLYNFYLSHFIDMSIQHPLFYTNKCSHTTDNRHINTHYNFDCFGGGLVIFQLSLVAGVVKESCLTVVIVCLISLWIFNDKCMRSSK